MSRRHRLSLLPGLLTLLAFILLGVILFGCASKPAPGPSTAGVQARVARATASNAEAQRYNDILRTKAERIEAKGNVIEKYWK